MSNSSNSGNDVQKRKVIIGVSALIVFIIVFGTSYWIGINLGTDSKEGKATSKVVDSSKVEKKEASYDKDNSDKEDTVSDEENKSTVEETNDSQAQQDSNKEDELSTLEKDKKSTDTTTDKKDMKPEETKVETDTLPSNMNKKKMWDIYNEGNRLYKQGKYEEALPKLKMSYEIKPDANLMPWITYQVGNCYKELNNNESALEFFQKVKDNYPNSQYVSSSDRMINEIQKGISNRD